jgi:glycosyltransferase involved in cell wall biosynthesis
MLANFHCITGMKLIIQIPCYNEEETLPLALKELPREIKGVDTIEWLVINDGSKDNTVKVARENGVDHIVNFKTNQGLAKVFMAGLNECIARGADIIVNTDADNQYFAGDIEKLIQPILKGESDFVIGERPISETEHFSFKKKLLQKIGSFTVRMASKTKIPDAPSGFRAISRDAALRLNVFNSYTYTLETIIQAGHTGIAITSVPIRTNEDLRPSRLVKSIGRYIKLSMYTILRVSTFYNPLKSILSLGIFFLLGGFSLGVRWLILFFIMHTERTHVPSLILASILFTIGIIISMMALLADLIAVNRKILEEVQYRVRSLEAKKSQNNE